MLSGTVLICLKDQSELLTTKRCSESCVVAVRHNASQCKPAITLILLGCTVFHFARLARRRHHHHHRRYMELNTGVPRRGLGFKPSNESSGFFEFCVCKIYCPSSAPMLIKS